MSDHNVHDSSYNVPTGGSPYHGADEGEEAAIQTALQEGCNTATIRTSEIRSSDLPFSYAGSASPVEIQEATSSGGDNDYWVAEITDPKRLPPCKVECEDLIELFQFSFAEGNAFKALFRLGMDRIAQGKPGDTPLRNAQKVAYYGARMEVAEERKIEAASAA